MKQLIDALYRVDNELLVAFASHVPPPIEEEKKETKKPEKPKPKPKKIIKKFEEEKKPVPGP